MSEKDTGSKMSYEREQWFGKLITNYISEASKFCFLHGNVRDHVLLKTADGLKIETNASNYLEFYDIIDYLTWQLTEGIKSRFNAVICYSLTRGFYIRNSITHSNNTDFFLNIGFNAPIIQVKPGEKYKEPQRPVLPGNDALQIIGQLLRQNQKIAVIIDHAEMIVPRNTFSNIHHEKLPFLEMLKDYSYDPAIYQSENLLVLISENIADIETMLFQGQFVQDIMIDMPDKDKRLDYLLYLSALSKNDSSTENSRNLPEIAVKDFSGEHNGLDSLSKAMNGFTLSSIDSFIRRIQTYNIQKQREGSSKKKKTINRKEVNLHRKKAIASDSAQLLQEVIPRGGFECVGGLTHIRDYFKDIAQKILNGQLNTVPKAILLAGPPGTGKSILAEALAKDARIPMVKMANIRDKYVGESERKLELVLNTLLAWQPILVFIDEIDQVLGQRVTSQEQGSATKSEARMFGRLLEFLGDDKHRGKVVWIGATNRPDQMDDAMLRRFDRKFPVLLPYEADNRKKILEAFKDGTIKYLDYDKDIDLDEVATLMDGYTGSEMEQIIINAMSAQPQNTPQSKIIVLNKSDIEGATDKFIASRNEDMYLFQSLLALDMCNHIDALPKPDHLPDSFKKIVIGLRDHERKNRQEAKRDLQTEITQLRVKIAHY